MLIHLTARARTFVFDDPDLAAGAWRRLRALFPDALAACLMGNHGHLVGEVEDVAAAETRFARFLGSVTRALGETRGLWQPAPPSIIADTEKLRRQVRYVALNAPREHLVTDPLDWAWSTHRDVVGAIADPWVPAGRLARAFGRMERGFAQVHHRYVSSDPSVAIDGTPFPIAAKPTRMAVHPLDRVATAACAATRAPRSAIERQGSTRSLFVQLAVAHGWEMPGLLALACKCDVSTIHRILARPPAPGLAAAALCLGDDRLLVGPRRR